MSEGYWTIGQQLAREAELQGKPMDVVCPACKGIGWIKEMFDEPRLNAPYQTTSYSKFIKCPHCSEPERRAWLERNCGIEGAMLSVRLSDWGPGGFKDERLIQQRRDAWREMNNAIKHRFGLLSFHGEFGSGKTMALSVVCNELRDQLVEVFYTPIEPLLDHLRSLYARREDTSAFWQRLLDIPVLALDEITRFHATDWAEQRVFQLVDTRYQRRSSHLTLFAMNDDPEEMASYLFSRMRDGKIVKLEGDMRRSPGGRDD